MQDTRQPPADGARALHDQGAAAMMRGDLRDAVSLFRRALGIAPTDARIHHDLGVALEEMGEHADAVECLEQALRLDPDFAQALNNLGNALQGLRRDADAMAAYRRAEALAPDSPEVQTNIANLLEMDGRHEEALARYRRAMALAPGSLHAHFPCARTLLALGRPEEALTMVDDCLARAPYAQDAIALKGLLLQELGRAEEASRLIDLDRLIRVYRPEPPEDYATIDAFNRDLARHAGSHPTLIYELYGSSTRGGRHSLNLLWDDARPARALKALLRAAYADYVDRLLAEGAAPILRDPLPACRVSAQAQLLEAGGYLEAHIHPDAWISGAYYIRIPDAIRGANDQAGWIEFGRPPEHIKITVEPETRIVEPEEGMLVLFPSCFFHRVTPFSADELRISLGTDLIPVRRL